MESIKMQVSGEKPLPTFAFSERETKNIGEGKVQNEIIDVVEKDPSKSGFVKLPNEIVCTIMRHLNPPNVKIFQKSCLGSPSLHRFWDYDPFKDDVFWHQVEVPPSIKLSPDLTLEQAWFDAFYRMPKSMQTMYIDANLFFDVFNAFKAQETDSMHRADIVVSMTVDSARLGLWFMAKKCIAAAEDFAVQAGKTLPTSAYESAMNECVKTAICLLEGDLLDDAKKGIAAAKDFAKQGGKTCLTVPLS